MPLDESVLGGSYPFDPSEVSANMVNRLSDQPIGTPVDTDIAIDRMARKVLGPRAEPVVAPTSKASDPTGQIAKPDLSFLGVPLDQATGDLDRSGLPDLSSLGDPLEAPGIPAGMSPAGGPAKPVTPPTEGKGGWFSDLRKNLAIGTNIAALDMRELVDRIPKYGKDIGKKLDDIDKSFGFETGKGLKRENARLKEELSPAMKGALDKKWWDDKKGWFGDAWSDPRAYAGGITQSLPEQAITMIPAMRLAKVAYSAKIAAGASVAEASKMAARTATISGAVSEGMLGGASSSREVRDTINEEIPQAILERSEAYKGLISSGMSPQDARNTVANDAATRAFIVSGVVTGMFGGMGDRALAKIFTEQLSKKTIKSTIGAGAKGALSEGVFEELPQSIGQQVAQNEAIQQADPTRELSQDVANQALGGLAIGGVQGGGMGAAAHITRSHTPTPATQSAPGAPAAPGAGPSAGGPGPQPGPQPGPGPQGGPQGGPQAGPGVSPEAEDFVKKAQAAPNPDQGPDLSAMSEADILKAAGFTDERIARMSEEARVEAVIRAAKTPEGATPGPEQAKPAQPSPEDEEYSILRAGGYTDENIADMSPGQRASEAKYYRDDLGINLADAMKRHPRPKDTADGTQGPQAKADQVNETRSGERAAPIKAQTADDVLRVSSVVADPTDPQAKAENYKHGHLDIEPLGLTGRNNVSIETGVGGTRRGTGPDGKAWEVKMPVAYGRIKGSRGADNEPVDIFVGPNPGSGHVFVLNQNDPSGKFDEHKVLAGFVNPRSAVQAYLASYSDDATKRIRSVVAMTPDQFKDWLKNSDLTKPVEHGRQASRTEPSSRVSHLEGHQESLQQSEVPPIQGLRGAGDQDAPNVGAGLPDVLGRDRSTSSLQGDTGSQGQRQGVRSGEFALGDQSGTEQQSSERKAGGDQRPDVANGAGVTGNGSINNNPENETSARGPRVGEILSPAPVYVEPTQAHHDQIEAVLGQDYDRVLPADAARAAEILAENEGMSPQVAFQQAVIEGAVEQKFLTQQEAVEAYGPEVQDILESVSEGTPRSGSDTEQASATSEQERPGDAAETGVVPESGETGGDKPGEGAKRDKPNPRRKAADEPDASGEADGVKTKIEDAGEKIGGARKDAWVGRGLGLDDLGDMTGAELDKYVTKHNIWKKPDYAQAVEDGVPPLVAALIKRIYDGIAVKPNNGKYGNFKADDLRKNYIFALNATREAALAAKTEADVRKINDVVSKAIGAAGLDTWDGIGTLKQGNARNSPLWISSKDVRWAQKAVEAGFPNAEPWTRLFTVNFSHKFDDAKRTWMRDDKGQPVYEWKVYRKSGGVIGTPYATKEDAEEAAKAAYDAMPDDRKTGGEEPKRPHLDSVERSGPDYRGGRDVTGEDFIKDFGFHGVEFGNYVASDERQKVVNLAYDALNDLARVLNLPAKAMSLDGTLSVAFGARGMGGRAAAHYEADRTVINMTKLAGAGSLAHEWAHALDHYLGEQASQTPYKGSVQSISGWRDTPKNPQNYYSIYQFEGANKRLPLKLRVAANRLMDTLFNAYETDDAFEVRAQKDLEAKKSGQKSWMDRVAQIKARMQKGGSRAGLKQAEDQVEVWGRSIKRFEDDIAKGQKKSVPTEYLKQATALSGTTGDYWRRPNELLARSFEAYVFDKIAAEGFSSQYLVQGVEPNRYGSGFKGNPYPSGDERTAINAAYDRLIRALDVGEGKHGKTRIQSAEGLPEPIVTNTKVTKPAAQPSAKAEAEAVDQSSKPVTLADAFEQRFVSGHSFSGILEARKFAKESGFSEDAKSVEEAIELAMVRAARKEIEGAASPKAAYRVLVSLYQQQPRLGTRTSTSVRDQAYSTPVPLAYLASELAGITKDTTVYEPTAGNGALLIAADPAKVQANELNHDRFKNLHAQGIKNAVYGDGNVFRSDKLDKVDVVIANPPFGPVKVNGESQVFDLSDIQPGYQTHEIDHAIALKALASMKDTGRAVLILGGINKLVSTVEGRSDAYNGKAKRQFYKTLYDNYNVTDHFTVAGELYERQGAAWPVDVIVIEGRGKSKRPLPAAEVPHIYDSWDSLGGLIDGVRRQEAGDARPGVTPAAATAETGPGLEGRGGRDRADAGSEQPRSEQPGGVRAKRGAADDANAGATGDQERVSADAGDRSTRSGEQPAAERPSRGLSDDLDDILNDALDAAYGKEEPKAQAKVSAKSVAIDDLPDETKSDIAHILIERVPALEKYSQGRAEDVVALIDGAVPTIKVPAKTVNPSSIKAEGRQVSDAAVKKYAALTSEPPPIVTEGNKLLEGGHRLAAAKAAKRRIPTVDISNLLKMDWDVWLNGDDQRSTEDVAKSAAENATDAADEAFSALYKLFGGPKASAGFTFDEDTYKAAKPHFERAAQKFKEFIGDTRELANRMVAYMRDTLKWPREVMANMLPYLKRFIIELSEPKAQETKTEAPRAKRTQGTAVETENQVTYKPQSKAPGLDTLVPVNMRRSISDALADLEDRVGPIDVFVAKELKYADAAKLEEYFGAEQVDALGLAIDNIKRGKGFIIGDQCVAGETLIYDPLFKRHVRIDDLVGSPHAVLALTASGFAPHAAVVTFKKGRADLYQVTLANGHSITVTRQHRFLTPNGWASIEDGVCSGILLATAQDEDTSSVAIHDAYDRPASRTPQDCLDRCWSDHRQCDEQSLSIAGIDPIVAQLRDGALAHILALSHADGLAPSPEYNPPSPCDGHHSKKSSFPSESRGLDGSEAHVSASGARSMGSKLQNGLRSDRWSVSCCAAGGEVLECSPSPFDDDLSGESVPLHISDDSKSSRLSACDALPVPGRSIPSDSCARLIPAWSPVVSVEFVRHDDFYDMYVPGPENYVAQGFVNHNTGIGKGRVNAAIIRWAIVNDRIPMFVTEKPGLYADMYRDLSDIGMDGILPDGPRILATNTGLKLPLDDAGKAKIDNGDSKAHAKLMMSLATTDAKAFFKSHDMVFTNYSQMQTVKGEDTARRQFMEAIVSNAVMIFDESHNAGGQKTRGKAVGPANRSGFARKLVQNANGVFYSSATYAKRPDVMDLYAATDMAMAVDDLDHLAEAIQRGGVPMQQVVATMLSEAGQYIRRERSFDGITYNTPVVEVNRENYDQISQGLSSIQDLSKFVAEAAKNVTDRLKAEGAALNYDGSTGEAGASSTSFTAVMHNVISQLLLAMKVEPAAQAAIAALERGEKPVMTVANTMESFLNDYADALGISAGEEISADFSDVLQKYLDRTRTIIIKKPFVEKGEKATYRHYLTDGELGGAGVAVYERAKAQIAGMDLSDLPVSPIDYLKGRLAKAGYKVGEITGRGTIVDYSGPVPILRARPGTETSTKGRNATRFKFNNGDIDAIIINQAGSTGISMHASERVKDQSKRHMFIVQPEGNIDTHMQLLGRVNRTGQVVLPEYSQLVAGIPAEKRPAAVLAKKMASLNANTTASRSSAVTAKDVPDFINEYGDEVAISYLADNFDMNPRLAFPVKFNESGKFEKEDAMRKLTGRIPLLPLKEQEEVYEHLEGEYAALLQQLEAAGENALEAKTVDLKAKTVTRSTVQAERNNSGSPFAAPVVMEKVSIARPGKPYKPLELMNRVHGSIVGREIEGKDDNIEMLAKVLQSANDDYSPLGKAAAKAESDERKAVTDDFNAYTRPILDEQSDPEKRTKELEKFNAVKDRWTTVHELVRIGRRVTLKTASGNLLGIVIGVDQKGTPKNPMALSTWKVTFAVPDATRTMTLPFSRVTEDGKSDPDSILDVEVVPMPQWQEKFTDTLERFSRKQTEAREERYIATGNLLSAYDWLDRKGNILNYTDAKGHIRQGILTSRDFDLAEHAVEKGKLLTDAGEIKTWLDANPDRSMTGGEVDIGRENRWSDKYVISAPKAKRKGGIYYLDKTMTDLVGDFYSMSGQMAVTIPPAKLAAALKRMMELGAKFKVPTIAPKEEKVEDEPMAAMSRQSDPPLTREAEARKTDIQRDIGRIVRALIGDSVDLEFNDGLIPINNTKGWGRFATGFARGLFYPQSAVIQIALHGGTRDIVSSTFHEAYHAMEFLLQTPQERLLMERETARLRRIVKEQEGYTDEGMSQLSDYEVRAIAFENYATERASGQTRKGHTEQPHVGIRRMFDRMIEFLRRVGNALRGLGFRTYQDIFRAGFEGEYRDRQTFGMGEREEPMAAVASGPGGPHSFDNTVGDIVGRRVAALLPNFIADRNATEGRVQLQDKFIRVKKVEESVDQPVPTHESAYQAESLYYGRTGQRLEQLEQNHIDPLIDEIKGNGLTLDEVNDDLYARHAQERNERVGAQHPPTHDFNKAIYDTSIVGASGMSTDEANAILRRHAARVGNFDAVNARVRDIIKRTRDNLLNTGLISQETYDDWNRQYKNYVPLRGFADGSEHEESIMRSGRGYDIRGKEAKKAFGRKSEADGPLNYILLQAELSIVRGEKNRVGNTMLRFVQSNPDPDLWEVNKPKIIHTIDKSTGLITTMPDNFSDYNDPNVFITKVGGKPYRIRFKGPDGANVARALNNMGATNLHSLVKLFAVLTRTMAKLATQLNPEFTIPNFVRDVGEAFINLQEQQQRDFVKSYAKHILPAVKGSALAISGKTNPNDRYIQAFLEMDRAGGRIRFFGLENPDDINRNIASKMRRLEGGTINSMRDMVEKMGTAVEVINGGVENGVRLATYMAARDVGMPVADAAAAARSVTVDFNRAGEIGGAIGAFYMFYNAAAQGTARTLKAVQSKYVRRAFYTVASIGAVTALYGLAAGGDDDDGTPYFLKIPNYERDKNFIIMWPKGMGHDGQFVKIPASFGLAGVFQSIGSRLASVIYGGEKPGKALMAMMGVVANTFDPTGGDENLVAKAFPSVLRGQVHIETNKNWTGKPLYPDNSWDKTKPDSQKFFKSDSDFSKAAAEKINAWTGGSKYTPGAIDMHPASIDHWLQTITGGVGRFAKGITDTAGRAYRGEEWEPTKTPILRRFYGATGTAQSDSAAYYDARNPERATQEQISRAKKDLRQGVNVDESRKFIEENSGNNPQAAIFKNADKQMSRLRKQEQQISSDTSLPDDEKKAQIKELRGRMREIQNDARKRSRELRQGQ